MVESPESFGMNGTVRRRPPGYSAGGGYAVAGNRLFFAADDGSNGRELWGMPLDLPNPLYLRAIVR